MDKIIEILLVEDNKNDAELALRSLKQNNVSNNIVWVKDGAEAVNFLFGKGDYADRNVNNKPKIILLDLKLPKIDGIEVLQKIRSDDLTRKLPVVMLTSSKEEKDIVKSYDLGVNSYIVKPLDFNDFAKAIGDIGLYWVVMNQSPRN